MNSNFYVKDFTNLNVRQNSRELTNDIYMISERSPKQETYGITSQIRRVITSVGANFAEGNTMIYKKKELLFFNNALGSAAEVRHWLTTCSDIGYITKDEFQDLNERTEEIIKMIFGCMKKIYYEINDPNSNETID